MKLGRLPLILGAALLHGVFWSYCLWSYSLTDPNLFLFQNEAFVRFQTYMWHTVLPDVNLLTGWFLVNVVLGFIGYILVLKNLFKNHQFLQWLTPLKAGLIFLLIILPLFFSSNALSHDIFNYMFNAKMVVKYGANPHVKVALDFAFDDWTRFMHNTHTPAPYWYGWTAMSLVPYLLGLGKFTLTWFMFRLYAFAAMFLTGGLLLKILRRDPWRYAKVAGLMLNPLILVEIISNAHNDFFMLLPAVAAIYLALEYKTQVKNICLATVLLLISASSKMASILLLPLVGWIYAVRLGSQPILLTLKRYTGLLGQGEEWVAMKKTVWFMASILMFLPLFLARSKQFLPWYLSWPLVFMPLFWSGWSHNQGVVKLVTENLLTRWQTKYKNLFNLWTELLLVFSFSSLLRYIPWLLAGTQYTDSVLSEQLQITWLIPLVYLLAKGLMKRFSKSQSWSL